MVTRTRQQIIRFAVKVTTPFTNTDAQNEALIEKYGPKLLEALDFVKLALESEEVQIEVTEE